MSSRGACEHSEWKPITTKPGWEWCTNGQGKYQERRCRESAEEKKLRLRNSLRRAYEDVRDFHRACGLPCHDNPTLPEDFNSALKLRAKLIEEETGETLSALYCLRIEPARFVEANMAEVADGIADSIYVLLGTAVTLGLPMAEIWRRVHESNMAKVKEGVQKREDGKIMKPDGWQPPDVLGAIREAMR